MYGVVPCIYFIILGIAINTTAYHLGQYSLHLLLPKSSMTKLSKWRIKIYRILLRISPVCRILRN